MATLLPLETLSTHVTFKPRCSKHYCFDLVCKNLYNRCFVVLYCCFLLLLMFVIVSVCSVCCCCCWLLLLFVFVVVFVLAWFVVAVSF